MSEDQVNQLKAKIQQQAAQFQSYREQCKQIQAMLQQDCQKKQQEIRQLKQDAIKRQKGQKMLKAQVSQLQAQVANLKTQVGDGAKNQSNQAKFKQQIDKLLKQNASLKQKETSLNTKMQQYLNKISQLQSQLNQSNTKITVLAKQLTEAQNKAKQAQNKAKNVVSVPNQSTSPAKDHKNDEQIKKLKQKIGSIQKQKLGLQKLLKQKQSQIQKQRHEYEQKMKKLRQASTSKPKRQQQKSVRKQPQPIKQTIKQSKQPKQTISLSQHKVQMNKLKQTIQQLQQKVSILEHTDKDQKQKLINLMNQKTALYQKLKKLNIQLDLQKQKRQQQSVSKNSYQSPPKASSTSQQIMIEDGEYQKPQKNYPGVRMDCMLLTKKHYISPFMQIKDNKLIKVYKSTKSGFQKSLGATRHKFDSVGYDMKAIVQNGVNFIKDSIQRGISHSVVIYGSKRTSKKYIMSGLVQQLRQWILQKTDQNLGSQQESSQERVKCLFVKYAPESQKNYQKQSINNRDEIAQILDEIISMGHASSPSKKVNKNKKPKVRYLLISFAGVNLQIITTSYMNPFIRNNQTFVDYLNTIVFSKLPNILQSSNNNYHVITVINPIVNLYEQCKNTLSITMVPFSNESNQNDLQPMTSTLVFSPANINKDDLNDFTKKKLQSFQKQTEQASIKVRKVQDQCNYLRNRFQQLEVRLKNLINTHQQQNAYLKKSPVTLSYQKLLKFVHTVLSRNTSSSRINIGNQNFPQSSDDYHQNQINMYIEEDAKSLDGY